MKLKNSSEISHNLFLNNFDFLNSLGLDFRKTFCSLCSTKAFKCSKVPKIRFQKTLKRLLGLHFGIQDVAKVLSVKARRIRSNKHLLTFIKYCLFCLSYAKKFAQLRFLIKSCQDLVILLSQNRSGLSRLAD